MRVYVWRKAHLGDSECRAPLSLENVEADATLVIDVRVVHLGHKLDFGRLERVVAGELNVELKDSTTVWICATQQRSKEKGE